MQAFLKTSTLDLSIKLPKEINENVAKVNFIRDGVLYDTKVIDKSIPSIPEFFKGRDIFVTGGTGFMGKVLIEKLLRSCPGINRIFMLMRAKKGKSMVERLKELKELPLFGPLMQKNPDYFHKIVPIEGDVCELKLGINDVDYKKMSNVSIIFHVAATVRFDDPLKRAIILNTRGTREVIRFAETLKNLKSFLHVSTTYCNLKSHIVEEDTYPPLADWKESIKIAESLDPDVLDILSQKYMNFMPNTYTFSKHLSEQIIADYKNKLPVIIFRPSVVISSMKDPIPGWIDNFNGPTGLFVSCGIGITRTMYCSPDNIIDFVPVDVAIKAMIVAAWKRAIDSNSKQLPVYNCSTSTVRYLTAGDLIQLAKDFSAKIAMEKLVWAPGGGISRTRLSNFIRTLLYHIIPAILLDYGLKLTGRKPFVLGLQRKVYTANSAIMYFILGHWIFRNENFLSLDNEIKAEDAHDFHYTDFIQFDIELFLRNCFLGGKRYLLGEKDEHIPWANYRLRKLKRVEMMVKIIFYAILFYVFIIRYNLINKTYDFLVAQILK